MVEHPTIMVGIIGTCARPPSGEPTACSFDGGGTPTGSRSPRWRTPDPVVMEYFLGARPGRGATWSTSSRPASTVTASASGPVELEDGRFAGFVGLWPTPPSCRSPRRSRSAGDWPRMPGAKASPPKPPGRAGRRLGATGPRRGRLHDLGHQRPVPGRDAEARNDPRPGRRLRDAVDPGGRPLRHHSPTTPNKSWVSLYRLSGPCQRTDRGVRPRLRRRTLLAHVGARWPGPPALGRRSPRTPAPPPSASVTVTIGSSVLTTTSPKSIGL